MYSYISPNPLNSMKLEMPKIDRETFSSDATRWNMLDPSSNKPDSIVTILHDVLPRGSRIFEFGAGRGRNAIPLAKGGMQVSVQDMSDKAI